MTWTSRSLIGWETALATLIVVGFATMSTLRADSPAGKEIVEVLVQGNRIRSTVEIMSKIGMKPGAHYSDVIANEDAGRLLAQGWFTPNGVQIYTQERPDGKIAVVFRVTELPSTIKEIIYRGANHLNAEELEKLTNLKKGAPMSPANNQKARLEILRKYQEMGRIWAGVYLTEGNSVYDTRVVFDVAEGPTAKIGAVEVMFYGPNTSGISKARLKTQVNSSSGYLDHLIGGDYNPIMIEQDVVKLADYYKNLGYLEARVQREVIWSENHRAAKIIFHVAEGPRYTVKTMRIIGSKGDDEFLLLGFTNLREGDTYDKFVVQNDITRLKNYKGYQGRSANVREVVTETGSGQVNVSYVLEDQEPKRVGQINIIGNTVTRDNIIRRQVGLYPGQILSYPDLLEAERQLAKLGIFDESGQGGGGGAKTTVQVENPNDGDFQDILIRVKEKPTGSFMVGAGVTSDAGLTGSVVINERNFDITRWPNSFEDIVEGRAWRGAGQEFRIEAVPGTQFQRYSTSWREPYLYDSRYSLATSVYFFQRTYAEYEDERVGARVTVSRRITPLWSVSVTERAEDVDLKNIADYEPPQILDYAGHSYVFGSKLTINRDSRDNYLRPTAGGVFEIDAEAVVGTYDFPLAMMENSRYFTTYARKDGSGKQVLAMKSVVEWAGDNTPVFERYYAGGFRSMRGFSFRGVGPYVDGFNVGGDFAILNSIEYQVPVMANDNLYLVGFCDHGTVEQSVEIKNYRVTVGAGVRISVPQLLGPVPLALDFGFPLSQGPGDHKQMFSFWLGFFN